MKRLLIIILFIVILINNVSATTFHGSIYDLSLNKINGVIIEVNSEPVQRLISNDGSYSFDLERGEYIITAKKLPNEKIAEEKISISSAGDFNIDLFADIDLPEEELLREINEDFTGELSFESISYFKIILWLLIISIILFLIMDYKKKNSNDMSDDLSVKVIDIIKSEGERISQKDLRKHFPLSEAKISLVISELESKNKIEKIKRGRGNILILKK